MSGVYHFFVVFCSRESTCAIRPTDWKPPLLFLPLQKHVVFGQVLSGYDTVKAMESVGNSSGRVGYKVTIVDCGELSKKDD